MIQKVKVMVVVVLHAVMVYVLLIAGTSVVLMPFILLHHAQVLVKGHVILLVKHPVIVAVRLQDLTMDVRGVPLNAIMVVLHAQDRVQEVVEVIVVLLHAKEAAKELALQLAV